MQDALEQTATSAFEAPSDSRDSQPTGDNSLAAVAAPSKYVHYGELPTSCWGYSEMSCTLNCKPSSSNKDTGTSSRTMRSSVLRRAGEFQLIEMLQCVTHYMHACMHILRNPSTSVCGTAYFFWYSRPGQPLGLLSVRDSHQQYPSCDGLVHLLGNDFAGNTTYQRLSGSLLDGAEDEAHYSCQVEMSIRLATFEHAHSTTYGVQCA